MVCARRRLILLTVLSDHQSTYCRIIETLLFEPLSSAEDFRVGLSDLIGKRASAEGKISRQKGFRVSVAGLEAFKGCVMSDKGSVLS